MKKLKTKHIYLLFCLATLFLFLINNHFLPGFACLVFLYLFHELIFSDHIYYDQNKEYSWTFDGCIKETAVVNDNVLSIPKKWQDGYNILCKVRIKKSPSSFFFDPYVKLKTDSEIDTQVQYFERGCNTYRYINITHSLEPGTIEAEIKIIGHYCQLDFSDSELIISPKIDIDNKKIMCIAPHPDDAEIAAFGLYSTTDCFLVTVTAGEAEPETFRKYDSDSSSAALLKGRVRAWDSIAIPLWAGISRDQCIQLGYYCKQLKKMFENPDQSVHSPYADINDSRVFREFNPFTLKSDKNGKTSWNQLVSDLNELIHLVKPDIIVTPHPTLDSHDDHKYTTKAIKQALKASGIKNVDFFYYANHLESTDLYPFGPPHTLISVPPVIDNHLKISGFQSIQLSARNQKNKLISLEMNHDLNRPVKLKKWLRKKIQQLFIRRYIPDYGHDEFFRKSVKNNEFFITSKFN
ncbi:PIG-L deacetylase family protein [Endozoicomonas euniceicola]|uniref:PIG-L family deacetylase n=1 Tax=Endozoicomonas euniceicola TaxID=1234143 RepID=A0ABY6H014_9GAMM|nr:PIG-L family deacetylase [Endozoicomonas euniceicola]UYM17979.1 PIG-L family deacetylase [Endozoicomonas euniceicola]